jgi:hypothetical protein
MKYSHFIEYSGFHVFENRVLRKIFVPKRNEVMGVREKLHNEELHDLYSSQSIISIINWIMLCGRGM